MGWKDTTAAAKKSGGLYLQLNDGDKKQIIVCGEPQHFYQIFQDKKEYTTQVPGSSFKFKVQIVEIEDGKMQGKLWSQGAKAFKRLAYLNEEFGGIQDKVLLVARKGSTKDNTEYNIDIRSTLTQEQQERIKGVKLPEMERKEALPQVPDDLEPPLPEEEPSF